MQYDFGKLNKFFKKFGIIVSRKYKKIEKRCQKNKLFPCSPAEVIENTPQRRSALIASMTRDGSNEAEGIKFESG